MPSSLIFTGLVVLWLLIFVPAVARHQQEVARPSGALLAGRVLARPGRRRDGNVSEEGDSVDDEGMRTVGTRPKEAWVPAARGSHRGDAAVPVQSRREPGPDADPAADLADEHDDEFVDEHDEFVDEHDEFVDEHDEFVDEHDDDLDEHDEHDPEAAFDAPDGEEHADLDPDDRGWERPPPRYRPGRGGFDPEADAESSRRRYAIRQRVVLALLACAVATAVVAAVVLRVVWWAHAGVDLVLVGYLVHLRRQVREEAAIRERRASRMAGTRRASAADDSELDEWARRGREVTRRSPADPEETDASAAGDDEATGGLVDELGDPLAEDGDTDRVRGVGEPIGLLPARRRGADHVSAEPESALPPLQPAPPPPLPPGTSLVVVDDDELDLHDLAAPGHPHRRAVGM